MRSREWLDSTLRFVEQHLPDPPATVFEIGCGAAGGFVPALTERGYRAIGVDPVAPAEALYERVTFEEFVVSEPAAAIAACASLHHVDDLDNVLDHIDDPLAPGGTIIVIEWAWERFDDATARWCFDRLEPAVSADERTWLHRHRDNWKDSGATWEQIGSAHV